MCDKVSRSAGRLTGGQAELVVSTNGTALGVRAEAGPMWVTMNKDGSCLGLYLHVRILWSRSCMDLLLTFDSPTGVSSALIVHDLYFLFVTVSNFKLVIAREGQGTKQGSLTKVEGRRRDRRKGGK